MTHLDLDLMRTHADRAERRLRLAVTDACPGRHQPLQHRDGEPPWCPECGRTNRGLLVRVPQEVAP